MIDLVRLGLTCKEFRKSLGVPQTVVANETNYTNQSISYFEQGKNDSFSILAWYLQNGLTIDDLIKGGAIRL